jgi:SAM-dependent methyltransferase
VRREAILSAVEKYYSAKFDEHGPRAQGVDWNSAESQELRFVQLARLFDGAAERFSVNDLGCGYGAFAAFLQRQGYDVQYTGYELSAAMLESARSTFRGDERIRFERGATLEPADYSVASGIFNVRLGFGDDEWSEYVDATIDDLAGASRAGFAFNMLTSYSDPERRRPDLYYADPRAIFGLCKRRHSRHVALLHDYELWEFTVLVRAETHGGSDARA